MKRTTIFADEDMLLELKQIAKAQNRTVADLVRGALQEYIQARRPKRRRLSFFGIGASGHADLSERVEEILTEAVQRESGWS